MFSFLNETHIFLNNYYIAILDEKRRDMNLAFLIDILSLTSLNLRAHLSHGLEVDAADAEETPLEAQS
jgi:hypothetical protein